MYGDRFFDTTQDEGFASQLRLLVGGLLTFSLVDFGDFNVSNATNFTNFTSFNNTGNFSNFTEYFNALTDDDDDFDFNETAFRVCSLYRECEDEAGVALVQRAQNMPRHVWGWVVDFQTNPRYAFCTLGLFR